MIGEILKQPGFYQVLTEAMKNPWIVLTICAAALIALMVVLRYKRAMKQAELSILEKQAEIERDRAASSGQCSAVVGIADRLEETVRLMKLGDATDAESKMIRQALGGKFSERFMSAIMSLAASDEKGFQKQAAVSSFIDDLLPIKDVSTAASMLSLCGSIRVALELSPEPGMSGQMKSMMMLVRAAASILYRGSRLTSVEADLIGGPNSAGVGDVLFVVKELADANGPLINLTVDPPGEIDDYAPVFDKLEEMREENRPGRVRISRREADRPS
jgi:hypothetical protein